MKILRKLKSMKERVRNFIIKKYCVVTSTATSNVNELVNETHNTEFKNRFIGKIARFCVTGLTVGTMSIIPASAAKSNTSSIDTFIDFACDWLVKIGGVVMLVGGVMFALGWQREDAEGKSRGLMTLLAGAMIVAIGKAPDIFGL